MSTRESYCSACRRRHRFGFDEVGAPVELASCVEAADPAAGGDETRPKIVCLSGSTRFIDHMAVKAYELEKQGIIALSCHLLPQWYCSVADHFAEVEGVADQMDSLHLRKIELADELLVINVGGYIGESTRREILYAQGLGKPIRWLEPGCVYMNEANASEVPDA